jgi:hypothetical protein
MPTPPSNPAIHVSAPSSGPLAIKFGRPELPPYAPVKAYGTKEEEYLIANFRRYYEIPVAQGVSTKTYMTATQITGDHHDLHKPALHDGKSVYEGKSIGRAYEIWFATQHDAVRKLWAKDKKDGKPASSARFIYSIGLGSSLQPPTVVPGLRHDEMVEPTHVQLFQLLAQQKELDARLEEAESKHTASHFVNIGVLMT